MLGGVGAALAQFQAVKIEINQNLGYYGAKLQVIQSAIIHVDRHTDANNADLGNIADADLADSQVRERLSRDLLGSDSRNSSVALTLFRYIQFLRASAATGAC